MSKELNKNAWSSSLKLLNLSCQNLKLNFLVRLKLSKKDDLCRKKLSNRKYDKICGLKNLTFGVIINVPVRQLGSISFLAELSEKSICLYRNFKIEVIAKISNIFFMEMPWSIQI